MLNVRLAGCHLYEKQLFTGLSLVVSFLASFLLSFFPLHVLDEIWDVIESVSEGFHTYSYVTVRLVSRRSSCFLPRDCIHLQKWVLAYLSFLFQIA